jgi:hypothetical protein
MFSIRKDAVKDAKSRSNTSTEGLSQESPQEKKKKKKRRIKESREGKYSIRLFPTYNMWNLNGTRNLQQSN